LENALRFVTLLAALVLMMACTLNAQVTGAITGTVYDSSNAVVSNAQVKINDTGRNIERRAQTDSAGRYSVELLPIGAYEIGASLAGFKESTSTSK
jgi:uncharacterized lipoprotein YajG